MNPQKIALATFVKTPGMSPIKTRLASSIGAAAALEFYIKCLAATHNTVDIVAAETPNVSPYWSVAEKQALGALFWRKWPQVWQGEGGLGERIAHVYSELKNKYDIVALYGADSPHIQPARLIGGLNKILMGDADTVVGPTEDGGFYFLASRLAIDPEVWTKVKYSTDQTLADLRSAWPGEMLELERDFDVDTGAEYKRLIKLLPEF